MNVEHSTTGQLRPEMSSRRLRVLDFVTSYITRWRASPSIGEIAAGCGIGRTQAKAHVRALARAGHLLRRPGPRGLALPAERDAAVRQLRLLGWRVSEDLLDAAPRPDSTLLPGPPLDYVPAHDESGTIEGSAGTGEGTAPGAGGDPPEVV